MYWVMGKWTSLPDREINKSFQRGHVKSSLALIQCRTRNTFLIWKRRIEVRDETSYPVDEEAPGKKGSDHLLYKNSSTTLSKCTKGETLLGSGSSEEGKGPLVRGRGRGLRIVLLKRITTFVIS
ncbi:ABC transporter [Striga asiatica]|uniref:ABC transporter n=1 Tax=Striga asiatica TaxID=4170 RepID=A0A5A7PZZ0_STRAF|nr:ABC transporter [Striga asiatica]